MTPKARKPRPLHFTNRVTVEVRDGWLLISMLSIVANNWFSRSLTTKEARKLAKWLLQYADWADAKEGKCKSK